MDPRGSYIFVEDYYIFPKREALRKNIVFRDKNITPQGIQEMLYCNRRKKSISVISYDHDKPIFWNFVCNSSLENVLKHIEIDFYFLFFYLFEL